MAAINFIHNIYNESFDRPELLKRLDIASNTQLLKISMIPFGCEGDPENYLGIRYTGNRIVEKIRDIGDTIRLFKLTHQVGHKNDRRIIAGKFFLFKSLEFDSVYIAATLENSEFYHRELRSLLNGIYPEFLFAFIKSISLKQLIQEFSVVNNITEVKIKRASQKIRFQDERSMSAVTWPNMSLEDAFSFIQDNNGWFKSLQFEALKNGHTLSEIFIDRQGRVRTDRQFLIVYDGFIKPACNLLNANYQLFSNRSRKYLENLTPRPLTIDYSADLFEAVSVNEKFINAVSKLDKSSVSVVHGNPYIHMIVTDYNDGSSFDIWVLKRNQIIIVPQMKGTVAGIKRLVNHIFDSFAEGEVKNYQLEAV
jgi:hypothetical protein